MSPGNESLGACWLERWISRATFGRHLDEGEALEVLNIMVMASPIGSADGAFQLLPKEWAAIAVKHGDSEKSRTYGLLRWLNTLHATHDGQVVIEHWLRQAAGLLHPRVEAEMLRLFADRVRDRYREHRGVVARQARRACSAGKLLALLSTAIVALVLLQQWNRDLELTIERDGAGSVACVPVLAAVRACRGPVDVSFQLDGKEAHCGGLLNDCVGLGHASYVSTKVCCRWQEDGTTWSAVRPASLPGHFPLDKRARGGAACGVDR